MLVIVNIFPGKHPTNDVCGVMRCQLITLFYTTDMFSINKGYADTYVHERWFWRKQFAVNSSTVIIIIFGQFFFYYLKSLLFLRKKSETGFFDRPRSCWIKQPNSPSNCWISFKPSRYCDKKKTIFCWLNSTMRYNWRK